MLVVGRVTHALNRDLSVLSTYCILSTTSYEYLMYTTQYTAGVEL
jgi:hypothetical protein